MYKSNFKKISLGMRKGSLAGIEAAAGSYRNAIRRSISGPPSTSNGNPPGIRSGRLREAISTKSVQYNTSEAAANIGIDTAVGGIGKTPPWLYGMFLEKGFMSRGGKFIQRPFMGPMARNSAVGSNALEWFTSAFRKFVK